MRPLMGTREYLILLPPVVLLVLTVFAWTYRERPFQDLLAHHTTSLQALSAAQERNVRVAARYLDGWVVGPGESLSFNAVVGPRTPERGFVESNAFLEGQRARSVGGGVCLLASVLYATAQQTSWNVIERVAHPYRSVAVPPGRDATVWYGQTDLRLENNFAQAVKIRVSVPANTCKVEFWGRAAAHQVAGLRFAYQPGRRPGDQTILVYRYINGHTILLSQDTYRSP
ncbi:MAG: VanW family protein [Candidatus Sericytochromatia bacterium]|nr:VanW family protein [Candidatus Sericytochromatia bacterium]